MKIFLKILPSVFLVTLAKASLMPPIPPNEYSDDKYWNDYCIGDRTTANIPAPNYANDKVEKAARKLAMISPYSFYFYSGPLYAYELRKGKDKQLVEPPASFPSNVKEVKDGRRNAHAFLTLLCGEFRDRPSLIHHKIRWVNRMYTLPATPQKTIQVNQDIWPQMSARSYKNYLTNTDYIFSLKALLQSQKNQISVMGKYREPDPVEPFSVCETKYIFKTYVEKNAVVDRGSLEKFKIYQKNYEKFERNQCNDDDRNHYYDFRGDSNFKPNSPESNGMIWYSTTISNNCMRRNGEYVLKEENKAKFSDPNICERYFKEPFAFRWSAARAGLAAWMVYDRKYDSTFSNAERSVHVVPNFDPMSKPFGFKTPLQDEYRAELPEKSPEGKWTMWSYEKVDMITLTDDEYAALVKKTEAEKAAFDLRKKEFEVVRYDYLSEWTVAQDRFWPSADLGFNSIVEFGTDTPNVELAYERLRNAVNRHTDWYASGYDDGMGTLREEAYSPFVASSYEMNQSDHFTAPGATVKSPADGCKHWMFVFKLKKDQWYTTQSLVKKTPVDFNRHWFDETSLGTNRLADSERALDRLGTALENEMDSILYLHNLTTDGNVDEQCGAGQMALTPDVPKVPPIQQKPTETVIQ